jgi:hypothetical protein
MIQLKTTLVELLNANGISILIGMITGTMINLITSDDGLFRYFVSIICFLAASLTLVVLLKLRDKIERKISDANTSQGNKLDDNSPKMSPTLHMTDRDRLSWVINEFDPAWGKQFLILTFITLALIITGVTTTIWSNKSGPRIEDQLKSIEDKLSICISNRGG